MCNGPERYDPFTNPTCAGAAKNAPVPHEEAANLEFLPAAKAGPGGCCVGPRGPEKPADERRGARNGGVRSCSAGGQNGNNRRKPGGEEESDGRTDISATQEA
ncbi:hypothetical protein NDU88_003436 [Pleurodeles waltl]|uniref:Uncharacterized protein n=1 Tax=Pleurodeles waltl TaxID=8319 RepID=A0AAV7M4J3_PLEWA|nr:hypothetical protein NDU88_003436 [Pleurodeles waltl]